MAESISEGTLKQWLKKKGEYVELDEEVATIETDKVRSSLSPSTLCLSSFRPFVRVRANVEWVLCCVVGGKLD